MSVLSDDKSTGCHKRSFRWPDMKLYEEIILLRNFATCDYVVENVISYYEPLIEPQTIQRHYFWSNKDINKTSFSKDDIHNASIEELEKKFGLSVENLPSDKKLKTIRNCVEPRLGKHIFNSITKENDRFFHLEHHPNYTFPYQHILLLY